MKTPSSSRRTPRRWRRRSSGRPATKRPCARRSRRTSSIPEEAAAGITLPDLHVGPRRRRHRGSRCARGRVRLHRGRARLRHDDPAAVADSGQGRMPRPAASGPLIALGKRAMHTDVTDRRPRGGGRQTQTATDAGRFRRGRRTRSARKFALGVAGILGFLVTWQLLPTLGIVDPRVLSDGDRDARAARSGCARPGVLAQRRPHAHGWGLGLLIATVAGHRARHDHRARPVPAPRDPHHRRVPAADPVGGAHPARRADVRLSDPGGADDHRLRELLAGVHPGALRGRRRRCRRP